MIKAESLTKDFGNGKGVFSLDLNIGKGEVFGFLGPNGAGKTTTIRMLLGFIRPDGGKCEINGMDSFTGREILMEKTGYLPAEIHFFDGMTGIGFLEFAGKLRHMEDHSYRDWLITYFGLDAGMKLSRMSKGMKQKAAIIAAFMHKPEILILDEPTTGLDPLMQHKFNDLVLQEKGRGATIMMSSHSFEEVEKTCDHIGIIRQGRMVAVKDIESLGRTRNRSYTVDFESEDERKRFESTSGYECHQVSGRSLTVRSVNDMNAFISVLSGYGIDGLQSLQVSLEDLFMEYYR